MLPLTGVGGRHVREGGVGERLHRLGVESRGFHHHLGELLPLHEVVGSEVPESRVEGHFEPGHDVPLDQGRDEREVALVAAHVEELNAVRIGRQAEAHRVGTVGRLGAPSPDHQGVTIVARRAGRGASAGGEGQGHIGHRRRDQTGRVPAHQSARAGGPCLRRPPPPAPRARGRWGARRDTRRRSSARSPRRPTAGRSHRPEARRPRRASHTRTAPPWEVARRGSRRSPSRRRATRTCRRNRAPPAPPGSRRCRPWAGRRVRGRTRDRGDRPDRP